MTFKRKELGNYGEDLAAQFLLNLGYTVLARNLKTRYGEIDLLAADGPVTVIVEVKTKTSLGFGVPAEMVHHKKQEKLRLLATALAQEQEIENYRIDVISVDLSSRDQPVTEHLIAAV